MKKIYYLLLSLFLILNITACSGYKPIFSSPEFKFKIADHSITGDKKLGYQIYSQLNYLSITNKSDLDTKNIYISISVNKVKKATAKNSAGKILAYKINLNTLIVVKDFTSDNQILNENFVFSSSYKVQDQYSETIKLENKAIENLINSTYNDLLIKLSEKIS